MKIVGVRLKKGIHKPIKDTAKIYYFMCPIKNVGIGDYVLLECDGTDKINIFQKKEGILLWLYSLLQPCRLY